MKNSFFLLLIIISISIISCKKETTVKPVPQPPAAKAVAAVKTALYDYQKAILVKRTITTN
jgi:hypothetical protein